MIKQIEAVKPRKLTKAAKLQLAIREALIAEFGDLSLANFSPEDIETAWKGLFPSERKTLSESGIILNKITEIEAKEIKANEQ